MNDPIKLSIYSYLFNAKVRSFDLDGAIKSFTSFADETVIATLPSEDDTYERLLTWENTLGRDRLKIIMTETAIKGNNRFDGDLKTAALKECSHPIRIIADCDEKFIVSQRPAWDGLAQRLLISREDGWLLPVVDLYGSPTHIRSDKPIGLKMRMHKATVTRRGVPAFAERGAGLFDTSQSDSTEPLLASGALASFTCPVSPAYLHPSTCHFLDTYVIHEGFLDLQRRATLGKTFWKQHWEARSGRTENVATNVTELMDVPLVPHRLKLS